MAIGTIKKFFITSETALVELDRMIRTELANSHKYSVTFLERIHATNFNYYGYIVIEDADMADEIIREIERKAQSIRQRWRISNWSIER